MTGAGPGGKLRGRRIAITRPAGQNERLAELIRAEGGEPIVFPVLEILDPADVRPLAAAADRLDGYDLAVFVSPSAVEKAMHVIRARREWPAGLKAATVGRGSEQALRRYGVAEVIVPAERFDSEALLDCRELADVAGRRIVVFRGDGGRELLGDTLRQRGATVDYVECYRRVRPSADVLRGAWDRGEVDAVTISSSEGLRNLFEMLDEPGRQRLKRTALFAPHARIAASARALGCERVIETAAGDAGLAAALAAFWEKM